MKHNMPEGWAIRWSASGVVVGIGAVAAFISYQHAHDLCVKYGEVGLTARLLPLTIDGLVYVASMDLLRAAKMRQKPHWLAYTTLALGIGATLAANIFHGLAHGVGGAIVSAWPAVALVCTFELAMIMIRHGKKADYPEPIKLVADPVIRAARQRYAASAVPSIRTIMAEMKVGYPKASRIRADLNEVAA